MASSCAGQSCSLTQRRTEEVGCRGDASLRWGIVLLSVALGFGLIQWYGWREVTPGLIAVLAGATGLGHLVFYAISCRLG